VGDIETNYSIDKVRQVKPAAMMVARYAETLPEAERSAIITKVHKMVLAVGEAEVATLAKRYADLKSLFPEITKLAGDEIAVREPAVMRGRDPKQPVLALANSEGYAVNFGALAEREPGIHPGHLLVHEPALDEVPGIGRLRVVGGGLGSLGEESRHPHRQKA
jgi:hypothetical protein